MSGGRSSASQAARLRCVAAIACTLITASCTYGKLSCNNRETRQSIAEAALESLAETANVSGPASEQIKEATHDFTLHDTYEISREGDVLSCHGTLGLRKANKVLPDAPIDYQVAVSNDGNIFFTFDKVRFGPAYVALIMLNATAQSAKLRADTGSSPEPSPVPPQGRALPYAADPHWSQWQH